MDFVIAVRRCFRNYGNGRGRAGRPEYWWFFLLVFVGHVALLRIHPMLAYGFDLVVFLPWIAVGVRRLHDTDRAGMWLLLSLVPVLGWIALAILMALPGTPSENRFGPAEC